MIKIKRALLSCWDKTGLETLARSLETFDVELISSGGTFKHLQQVGLSVQPVEEVTGSPEILGGRVKTLHPAIHGAILATNSPAHLQDLQRVNTAPIQLVVVNLYPFVEEAVSKNLDLTEAVEFIDIGGPTLLRAAAKNHRYVIGLSHPSQYDTFVRHLHDHEGSIPTEFSQKCAQSIFFYTSWYDAQINQYLQQEIGGDQAFPDMVSIHLRKEKDLRYGENPHQAAAVYRKSGGAAHGLTAMQQLWGKPLSFNNYIDVNAAYALACEFDETAVAIIKHTNPCGAGISPGSVQLAFEKALRGDSLSAFGGIVASNSSIDKSAAEKMAPIFFECIIAPDFSSDALEILKKKKNLRLLKLEKEKFLASGAELRSANGAFIMQEPDKSGHDHSMWQVVTEVAPDEAQRRELAFAWIIAKHVKSNAIVFSSGQEIFGVGAGQMSRVDSVKIAQMKAENAGRDVNGCIMGSDAFFPFRDGVDAAAAAGIKAIIQPGGSIRDEEVIAAANEHRICMVFTGERHFKH